LAVLAAFFCLLFFAAAKKSRCRPAQGRRVNGKHRSADASENTSKPTSRRRRQSSCRAAQVQRMNSNHRDADVTTEA
ncbi:hypothetical protein, partial [Paraburkholderia hospita]